MMRSEPFARASQVVAAAALLCTAPLAVLAAQCDSTAAARRPFTGQVVDARALSPVSHVTVTVVSGRDTLGRMESDSTGHFAGALCARTGYTAHFRRDGFRADSTDFALDSARWAPLDVAMAPLGAAPITLAATRVTATRTSSIEARAKRSGGFFIGPAEIERRNPTRVSDLLRGQRGIAVEGHDGALEVVAARGRNVNLNPNGTTSLSTRDPRTVPKDSAVLIQLDEERTRGKAGTSCRLLIGVDGQLMQDDFNIDDVPAQTVIGLEIYNSLTTIPVEFRATRQGLPCGLVMIWTQNGKGLQ